MRRKIVIVVLLATIALALMAGNVFFGAVHIPPAGVVRIILGEESGRPAWRFILLESRLPQAVTALCCGSALGACGLLLQTLFANPLADSSILGIGGGAALGAALVTMAGGGVLAVGVSAGAVLGTIVASLAGALLVTALLLVIAARIRNHVLLLIIGLMIGYLSSSAITLLTCFSTDESLKAYAVWGMGSFSGVSASQLPLFCGAVMVGLLGAVLLVKPLGALVLGERYAGSLGVNVRRVRLLLLLVVGLLTAVTTAFCGPVAFIGLAVPHMARMLSRTDNFRWLMPVTLLMGADVALLCNVLSGMPAGGLVIPLNAVTPLVGAPVVIYVIMRPRYR